ncbi:MAG: hypothetical protein JNL82_15345 [Myxococcales bacterium]|nr:hypothetical protein [Myxococcales bacterium]
MAITCTIRLDPMYPYWDYVDIEVAGIDQPLTDCSTAGGWAFTSDDHDEIRLCPARRW